MGSARSARTGRVAVDSQALAGHMDAHHGGRAPDAPGVAADGPLALVSPAGSAENEQEGDIRGRIGQHVGRVADDDAPALAGLEVDVFVADRECGDDADRVRQPGDAVRRQLVGRTGQQGLASGGGRDDFVAGIEPIRGIEDHIVVAGKPRLDGGGQPAGHEHAGLGRHRQHPVEWG